MGNGGMGKSQATKPSCCDVKNRVTKSVYNSVL